MKDKIIIDGADVSKCEFYRFSFHKLTDEDFYVKFVDYCILNQKVCKNCSNCYFKQLQRALKENIILKHQLKANENRIKDVICICKQCVESVE